MDFFQVNKFKKLIFSLSILFVKQLNKLLDIQKCYYIFFKPVQNDLPFLYAGILKPIFIKIY